MMRQDDHGIAGSQERSTLHLPRILCLHGGGSNARIFHTQCRALIARLQPHFRLCFAEAPFPSEAGPDVLLVYEEYEPFRRWYPGLLGVRESPSSTTVAAIEQSLAMAMENDDRCGATGEWAALLGFSQGAQLAASLLLRQQVRNETLGERAGPRDGWRFAVLMAGRQPISLDSMSYAVPTVVNGVRIQGSDASQGLEQGERKPGEKLLRMPTIHVHGLQDPGLELHRQSLEHFCAKGSTRLVEWDAGHRLPFKSGDASRVVEAMLAVAAETEF